MQTLRAEHLTKTYGEKTLFNDVSFIINEHDRIGLIGVNGSGKSSLLNTISGLDHDSTGQIVTPNSYTIGYLKQHPVLNDHLRILDAVFAGQQTVFNTIRRYEQILDRYSKHPMVPKVQQQYEKITTKMNQENAWTAENRVKTILTQLKIKDLNQKVGTLSGGQKRRVGLAQVLIQSPDLLLLDEPTNHLDFGSVDWLQDYLAKYHGALVVITHDRYFLDQVANQIWELSFGQIYHYQGNYQTYVTKKHRRVHQAILGEHKEQKKYKKELAWMHHGVKARGTRQQFKIDQFNETKQQVNQLKLHHKVDISLGQQRLGKKVIQLKHANLSLGSHRILRDFSLLIQGGQRIGISGRNGAGKTSFLNVIAKKTPLDSGTLSVGSTVKFGYYTQQTEPIPGNQRIINYLTSIGNGVTDNEGNQISVTQLLEQFLFPRFMHGTLIRKLSGGEKRRLYLLKILMQKPNVLLLDEPTNDLDISTLTVLENYIHHFSGTVITVSHDRYFLDQVADRLLIFDGDGRIEKHVGKFTDVLAHRKRQRNKSSHQHRSRPKQSSHDQKKPKRTKLTYAQELKYQKLGPEIDRLGKQKANLEKLMTKNGNNYDKLAKLQAKVNRVSHQSDRKMNEWLKLGEIKDNQ